jgi:lipid A 3-O-deacylase
MWKHLAVPGLSRHFTSLNIKRFMQSYLLSRLAICFLIVVCMPAKANGISDTIDDYLDAKNNGAHTTFLNIDNDSLLFNRSDKFYTSGIQLGQRYLVHKEEQANIYGWRFGQELYTPSDIKLPPELVKAPDHPYAGWLYGGFFKENYAADGTHSTVGLDLGCIGPCAGGYWTQTNLHRLLNQPQPQGWSKQVKNEFGVVLYADGTPVRWQPNPYVDIAPNWHGRFGNIFTDIGGGLSVRAGKLNVFPDQPFFHAFTRVDAKAVAYNATLQGGYFSSDNPHTVQPKRFVGEAEAGVAWSDTHYGVIASIIRRSNEIAGLSNAIGAQNFVRLLFSYTP